LLFLSLYALFWLAICAIVRDHAGAFGAIGIVSRGRTAAISSAAVASGTGCNPEPDS
jgi:hypothetical protein